MAIYKGTKKSILYQGDYEPASDYLGDKELIVAEVKATTGKTVEAFTEYKPKHKLELQGNTTQETSSTNVLNVNGYSLKIANLYNIGVSAADGGENGIAQTHINGHQIYNGTATARTQLGFIYSARKPTLVVGNKYLILTKDIAPTSVYFYVSGLGNNNETGHPNWLIATATTDSGYGQLTIPEGVTVNNLDLTPMIVPLTELFGSGNEPTTLEQFYATKQGQAYRGTYIDYGYHILGAGEYKSNQLVKNGNFSDGTNWSLHGCTLSVENNTAKIVMTTTAGYLTQYSTAIVGHKYFIKCDIKSPVGYNVVLRTVNFSINNITKAGTGDFQEFAFINTANSTDVEYRIRDDHSSNREEIQAKNYISIDLTELGLDYITSVDELKQVRPDLFKYQPYHETEKRYGFILNNGEVARLTSPLYGLDTIRDNWKSDGNTKRNVGVVDLGTLNWYRLEKYQGTIDLFYSATDLGMKTFTKNYISTRYKNTNELIQNIEDKCCTTQGGNGGTLWVRDDSFTDATSFKNSLSGVKLYYELATPTTSNFPPMLLTNETIVSEETQLWDEQWESVASSGARIETKNLIPVIPNSKLFIYLPKGKTYIVEGYNQSKTKLREIGYGDWGNTPKTIPSDVYYIKVFFNNEYGYPYKNDISFYYSQTSKGYIPYTWYKETELIPSPNFPKEVKNVSEVKLYGKNLWDEEWERGSISTTGVDQTDNNRIRSKNYIDVLPNHSYCFNDSFGVAKVILFYDKNKEVISYISGSSTLKTFDTPNNCYFIRFRIGSSTTPITTYNHEIMLTEGTIPLPYEPYVQPISIPNLNLNIGDKIVYSRVVGKNLFDYSNLTNGYHLDTNTYLPSNYSGRCCLLTPIDVSKYNSVTISFKTNVTGYAVFAMYSLFNKGEKVRRTTSVANGTTIGVSNADKMYVGFYVAASSISLTKEDIYDIQLEQGNISTDFEPYMKNRVLRYHTSTTIPDMSILNFTLHEIDGHKYFNAGITNCGREYFYCDIYGEAETKFVDKTIFGKDAYFGTNNIAIFDKDVETAEEFNLLVKDHALTYDLKYPYWEDITDSDIGQAILNMNFTPFATNFIEISETGVVYLEHYKLKD